MNNSSRYDKSKELRRHSAYDVLCCVLVPVRDPASTAYPRVTLFLGQPSNCRRHASAFQMPLHSYCSTRPSLGHLLHIVSATYASCPKHRVVRRVFFGAALPAAA